jgi:hypothetical protein
MYVSGLKHFYIEEVSRLDNVQLVMPMAWIRHNGELCTDCHFISVEEVIFIYIAQPHTDISI